MALIENWLPASRENFDSAVFWWQFYPLICSVQWVTSWYGMGKTSADSKLNIPGHFAWMTMEVPGFITLLYIMNTLPAQLGIAELPWQNKVLGALFVIHYIYRAVLFPWLQPSMAPIHASVWSAALMFQLVNATCIGGWLAGYGPVTEADWAARMPTWQFVAGIALFYLGLAANYYHDDELREIRWREQRRQERIAAESGGKTPAGGIKKHYEIPKAGLFKYMLYPHYFVEWLEWTGFYVACGLDCVPARMFVLNEVAAMLPRAVRGKQWYIQRFGEEKIKGKWAVIPGIW